MTESALRISLVIREMSRASWIPLLELCAEYVFVGLLLDGFVIVSEYREHLSDFRRGVIHSPERPSDFLLFLGLLGTFLIAGGVAGELFCQSKIGTVETEMRLESNALVSLVSKQIGSAKDSAEASARAAAQATASSRQGELLARGARQEADSFEKDIKLAKEQAASAERDLGDARREAASALAELTRIKTPRSLIDPLSMTAALKKFSGTEYTFSGVAADEEAVNLLRAIDEVLQDAGWKRVKPIGATVVLNFDLRGEKNFGVPQTANSGVRVNAESTEDLSVLLAIPPEKRVEKLPFPLNAALALNITLFASLSPREEQAPDLHLNIGTSKTVSINVGRKL